MIEIDEDRFRQTFEEYSSIGATDAGGLHRLALSESDKEVRDLFVSHLEALDLEIRIDEVGNVFGRREGTDPSAEPVLIGSHLDSQPYGGRFDGQLGVLCALETLRAFEDHDLDTRHPIEIVNWTNEEGTRFKPACMGSATFVGDTAVEETLGRTDRDGVTVAEALEEIGYAGSVPSEPREDYHACLELHVEQGPTLEENGNSIGVVEGVYGMAWMEATIYGESDHAGPTPMHTRTDALVAASDAITGIRNLALRLGDDVVTTVGEQTVEPGSINVIPNEATFTVDIRSYDDDAVSRGIERIEREVAMACEREGCDYEFETLWHTPHSEFAERVQTAAIEAAEETGSTYQRIVSGAAHDALYLDDIADTGMLFVPSVDGKTHNEAEFTEWSDCVAGASVFANTTERLATDR